MILYKRIDVGRGCNNNCLCCPVSQEGGTPSLSDITAQMNGNRRFDSVAFFGGEPTSRPDFFDMLHAARQAGYKRIKILTNARAFADINVAAKTIQAGCYFFEIKVHHHEPAIHDAVTRVRGSWDQTVQGIENLRRIDMLDDEPFHAFLHLRIPLSRENYRDVGNVALSFVPYEIDRITLSLDDSAMRLAEVLPHVRNAINAAILNRVWITTRNIPLCAMTGFEHHVEEIYSSAEGTFEKSKLCKQCVYDEFCPGISPSYLDRFGFRDLKPVSQSRHAEDIRRLRNEES